MRAIGFAFFFFLVTLLPLSSVFPTVDCLVERRVYLPNFGWCFFIAVLLSSGSKAIRKNIEDHQLAWALFLVLILGVYSIRTITRNEVFASDESIWKESLDASPDGYRAVSNLAVIYLQRKEFGPAKQLLDHLIELYPRLSEAWNNLGTLYEEDTYAGYSLNEALKAYQHSAEMDPRNETAKKNMKRVLMKMQSP